MNTEIKLKPMCEKCGKNEANSFSCFGFDENQEWKFVCNCSCEDEDYYIRINDYEKKLGKEYSWMDHMSQKTWFDKNKFISMLVRYEKLLQ